MISQKKLEANRRNAQKSTGPTSDEGKAIASRNSFKHGMYASNPLLDDEDPTEFQTFRHGIVRQLCPQGPVEELLADRIICNAWRLRRIGEIENWIVTRKQQVDATGFFHGHRNGHEQSPTEVMAAEFIWNSKAFEQLCLHEQRLQRSMQAALRQLMQVQKQRRETPEEHDVSEDAQNMRNEPTDSSNSRPCQEKAESADSCPKPPTIGHLPQDRLAIGGDMVVDGRYNLTPERLLCSPGVKPSARPVVLEDKESPI